MGGTRRFVLLDFTLVLPVPPHFFGLAQRNGVEPQRKTLLGWWRPREVSGPARLSHSRGRCHSAAKVSASRTDCITRRHGEGLGSDVDWRLKVFCPAFLQKSGRGPGAEPWPRAAAGGIPHRQRSAGGGQRGNPRRGFPLCGRPRRPQSLRRRGAGGELRKGSSRTPTPTGRVRRHGVCGHPGVRAGVEPRPYRGLAERGRVGGGRRKGSSRTPTPTAGGKRAVCRIICHKIILRPVGAGGTR